VRRGIFVPKIVEVTGGKRKLHNEESSELHIKIWEENPQEGDHH
jgi:hypothetical protein